MRRILLLALVCAVLAQAQWALFSVEPERRIEGHFDMGSVPAGDAVEARFRLQNISSAPAPLTFLEVMGSAFSRVAAPTLPQTVAPSAAVEFTIRFAPAAAGGYSATLRADSLWVILLASATPALTVAVEEEDGGWRTLSSGATVDFGAVERGIPATKRFVLSNYTGAPYTASLSVTSGAFALAPDAPRKLTLAPGHTEVVTVLCVPEAVGAQEAVLGVGPRRFTLHALGVEPPLPAPAIVVELPDPRSVSQGRVSVRLAEPSRTRASGELRLAFEPAPGLGSDPAIVFATGGSSAAFSVEEGDITVRFGGKSYLEFQTGSTAGDLVFTVEAGGHQKRHVVTIAPAPVGIVRARALRYHSSVEVEIAGWDNTRAASGLTFTFFDKGGKTVPPGPIQVDAAEAFRSHFAATDVGGTFLLRAVFPVTGPSAAIDAVETDLLNPAGTGRSGTVRLSPPD